MVKLVFIEYWTVILIRIQNSVDRSYMVKKTTKRILLSFKTALKVIIYTCNRTLRDSRNKVYRITQDPSVASHSLEIKTQ